MVVLVVAVSVAAAAAAASSAAVTSYSYFDRFPLTTEHSTLSCRCGYSCLAQDYLVENREFHLHRGNEGVEEHDYGHIRP